MSELKLDPIIADDVVWGKTYYEADAVDKYIRKLKTKIETLEELAQCGAVILRMMEVVDAEG